MGKALRRTKFSASAAVMTAALAVQPATALEYNFGGVQVFLDTTVSAGVSMRVADRNNMFLPEGNGGPVDLRNNGNLTGAGTTELNLGATLFGGAIPATVRIPDNPDNFDGSINSDDGRLNFDRGDLTSGVVKMTNDIQANYENYKFFARVSSFYDAVLDRDSSYERSRIGDGAKTDAARDIDLLDFYVSGDFNVGSLPLNVRLGKQVVNWGEATFIQNGISSWNPFDVNAFRRPGAEIKEGLLPVWGAYASLGLPYDLSLEAFYQLEFQPIQLDRPGTPFASSDVARVGSLTGGNVNGTALIGGSPFAGTFRRNCALSPIAQAVAGGGLGVPLQTAFLGGSAVNPTAECAVSPFVNYNTPITNGLNEQVRLQLGDLTQQTRLQDQDAKDSGQYGVALRWYAEDLNSTEFGFYFMNYHSRLPIARITAGTPTVNISVTSDSASAATRQFLNAGCGANFLTGATLGAPTIGTFADPRLAALDTVAINDPNGYIAAYAPIADAILAGAPFGGLGGNFTGTEIQALGSTIGALTKISCALAITQSTALTNTGAGATQLGANAAITPALVDGAEILSFSSSYGLRLEYPEDIQLYGASFNTTVGDWGVQGEVAFRHDQPLQIDTDTQTIAAATAQCAFVGLVADAVGLLEPLGTQGVACDPSNIGGVQPTAFVREEVVTFDIGTTATYTSSNPLVGALGADLGILLTEIGAMYVPDAPDEGAGGLQLGNACSAGTDLALGFILNLDSRNGCRVTQFSYGYVLVGQLQYNNAFGTPITLTPSVSWSHDVKGNSPAPLSNYREGSKSVSLALNGTYQNSWRGGISYVNNFGNEKFSKDGDKDFVSINLSYSF